MNKEKSCGAIIFRKINNNYEFLIIEHKKGHYGFPKGHIENNETEKETALREIKEETNINVKIDTDFRYQVSYSPKQNTIKDVIYFVAEKIDGKEKPQEEEIKTIRWISAKEALNLITFNNDKEVFIKALNYLEQN